MVPKHTRGHFLKWSLISYPGTQSDKLHQHHIPFPIKLRYELQGGGRSTPFQRKGIYMWTKQLQFIQDSNFKSELHCPKLFPEWEETYSM